MTGCEAATWIAYAMSDVATIYPISPIAEMGQTAQLWAKAGLRNLSGQCLKVKEMESELGAAGAVHGAAAAGALATTFTNSQGLLLMIPNMYKIAGEMLPAIFHVGSRSLASHALSIFSDHQDVMAVRTTGFAILSSNSVQEAMDMALVAHLAAIDGSLPVCHFFDGWRTSAEMHTIEPIPYDSILPLVDRDKVAAFRRNALNPRHPQIRGTAQNPDVYFQNIEARNGAYQAFPAIVQAAMDRVSNATGRSYRLFDYAGHPQAEYLIVAMGSSCEVIEQTIDYLNRHGSKLGLVKVRLYRPWSSEAFMAAVPDSVKAITVLDRTVETGAPAEPLMLDVAATVLAAGRAIKVYGGRYGLGSKEFDPAMVQAVVANMTAPEPRTRFTVGINDDVTHLSLDVDRFPLPKGDVTEAIFYGMGSDGTVGATKQAAKVLGDTLGFDVQAYFQYSAKKSGGYTISELRFGQQPVRAEYMIEQADIVVCNKDTYVNRFDLLDKLTEGGIFLLNTPRSGQNPTQYLPPRLLRKLARLKARLYTIDAGAVAEKNNLGVRVNMIMESVFFKLICDDDTYSKAIDALRQEISATYIHEGQQVVDANLTAIEDAVNALTEVKADPAWADMTDTPRVTHTGVPSFIANVALPCMDLKGDSLPVSMMNPAGITPPGTTAYEKRRIATAVPHWDIDKCITCAQCSFVCPHAAIRPYVLDAAEASAAPAGFTSKSMKGDMSAYRYRIQVYPEDCTGCASCVTVCPGHALSMSPLMQELPQQAPLLQYAQTHISSKAGAEPRGTVRGSQFYQPLLEFSGACAGCGETPYVKLLTQLTGERLIVANATGCSSIWGANFPSTAYCTLPDGRGPAWGNSLFEDNAEYAYGILSGVAHRRERIADAARALVSDSSVTPSIRDAAARWLDAYDDYEQSEITGKDLASLAKGSTDPRLRLIDEQNDMLGRKAVWAIGGDGWAYDIGFAGLDHVLAQNDDINILVLDTECYSNTGGQMSKATPLSSTAKFAPTGKTTFKKDLARMMMTYPGVYVAQIAMGASMQQAVTALTEAQAHRGPSIVIAYCPCINHGIRAGMNQAMPEMARAVKAGYWQLYRYNPDNPGREFTLDWQTIEPDGAVAAFGQLENRYADLQRVNPENAAELTTVLQRRCDELFRTLSALGSLPCQTPATVPPPCPGSQKDC